MSEALQVQRGHWNWGSFNAGIGAGVLAVALVILSALGVSGYLARLRERGIPCPPAMCAEIGGAQSIYHRTDWDGDGVLEYAMPYTLLYYHRDAGGKRLKLISEGLALAASPGMPLKGYYYVEITADATSGSYRIGDSQPNEFGICAVPADYPKSGRETYIMDTTGHVYGKDNGGRPVTVFPANPRGEGWVGCN